MLKFDLPYKSDIEYIEYINSKEDIYSIYYSFGTDLVSDARIISTNDKYLNNLKLVKSSIKKYTTLNGRYTPITYFGDYRINKIKERLYYLKDNNILDGILILDTYLFNRILEVVGLEFFKDIDITFSINNMIFTKDKIISDINYLYNTVNKIPTKIILDRSLNRNLDKLSSISYFIRSNYKNSIIETLVNEGCIYQCPFKINHDIFISVSNDKSVTGYLQRATTGFETDIVDNQLNEIYGCNNYFSKNPYEIIKSPFVRPEDINYIEPYVDVIKISGKIKPYDIVINMYESYKNKSYDGNLLDLLDTVSDKELYLDNKKIPNNFFKTVSSCDKNCMNCNYCKNIIDVNE